MISSDCLPQSPFRISDSEASERASMPEVYKFGKTASSLLPIYSTSFLPPPSRGFELRASRV